ncbi:hypothetical protein WR25_17083 [Diploscapter pachys]|uniref:Uncharacterized protein n=1 Tax=Diploscapter pachys TaxID=2018661 RepID=A0A2A2K3S3_9BILA|nr:hypothetical protein WR25_17083 [Diploscapter pachys]
MRAMTVSKARSAAVIRAQQHGAIAIVSAAVEARSVISARISTSGRRKPSPNIVNSACVARASCSPCAPMRRSANSAIRALGQAVGRLVVAGERFTGEIERTGDQHDVRRLGGQALQRRFQAVGGGGADAEPLGQRREEPQHTLRILVRQHAEDERDRAAIGETAEALGDGTGCGGIVRTIEPQFAAVGKAGVERAVAEPLHTRWPSCPFCRRAHRGFGHVARLVRADEARARADQGEAGVAVADGVAAGVAPPCRVAGDDGCPRRVRYRGNAGGAGRGIVHRDERHAGLGDSRLLTGDVDQVVAEECLVIHPKRGNAGDGGAADDVGRIESTAQANLHNRRRGGRAGEGEEGGSGRNLEEAGADAVRMIQHFGQQIGERCVVDQLACDPDAFVEPHQMRTGEDAQHVGPGRQCPEPVELCLDGGIGRDGVIRHGGAPLRLIFPVNDHVEHAVIQQIFGALESFGQFFADGQAGIVQHLDRHGAARHLHEAEDAFLHARAAGGGEDDVRGLVGDRRFDAADEGFADSETHRSAHEAEVLYAHHDAVAQDRAAGVDKRILFLRGRACRLQAIGQCLAQRLNIGADGVGRIGAVLRHDLDDRGADDDAIGHGADRRGLRRRADAETDRDGQVGRRLQPRNGLVDRALRRLLQAGDAGDGDIIEEAAGAIEDLREARGVGCGRREADRVDPLRP